MNNGLDIEREIKNQVEKLQESHIEPRAVVLGSYAYFLLKDHYQRTGNKTSDRYIEMYVVSVLGYDLMILIDRETALGGQTHPRTLNVKVYGD